MKDLILIETVEGYKIYVGTCQIMVFNPSNNTLKMADGSMYELSKTCAENLKSEIHK